LSDMGNVCQGKPATALRVIEIGCGAGGLTRTLAATFGEVHGVNVSDEMISLAQSNLSGLTNMHLHRNNGADLAVFESASFDFGQRAARCLPTDLGR